MIRILKADADAYVTSKVVAGQHCTGSNVGAAGTLDLYKLYGESYSGTVLNLELSRLLISFDLDPLRELVADRRVDPGHSSFSVTLKMFDVYGGQPTPSGFSAVVHPLSMSFAEGLGRDVVFYGDRDACNFASASHGVAWHAAGCDLSGSASGSVDYIDNVVLADVTTSLGASQVFDTGFEDLSVDVTRVVSATLAGLLPDQGFRIALALSHETDDRTYFVKRFASRHAYDETRRPRLVVAYDDSLQDDTAALELDTACTMVLRNRSRGRLAPILSGGVPVTGHDCVVLKMQTEVSGAGWVETQFFGSQHANGVFWVTGVYTASVFLDSSDPVNAEKLAASGSIVFRPIWGSVDGTVAYLTGSTVTVMAPDRSDRGPDARRRIVTVTGMGPKVAADDMLSLRVNIFDPAQTATRTVRLPIEERSIVMRDVHVSVRNAVTDEVVLPFDTVGNSSRTSSDALGHYFELDAATLVVGQSYVIDVMLTNAERTHVHRAASSQFCVVAAQ